MERKPHLLLACLFAFPAMAQTVVNKGDDPTTPPSDGTVIHMVATAFPINSVEAIPLDLQVPKEAISQPFVQEPGAVARPAPISISGEAIRLGPGTTPSLATKEIIGGDGTSGRPGETIVLPPVPAIHVGTRGLPPRPEAPSE